jgi:surface protein
MDTSKNIKGYQLIKRIGKGGCGAVYLAQKENENYAIKKITDLTEEEIKYYQKILNVLFKIKSQYVIKYYESFIENDCLYIVMEYGGNIDLKKYIEKQDSLIDEKIIKDIIIQICLGLKEIHKNKLIHRDLTPDNIFMDKNNKIKIGDFVVSKILTTTKNYTVSQVGKHHYFAPEIEKGEKYNNKVDIYALGCIIYELFTLNEYYNVKNENVTINTKIYNPKWQNLIDLTLNDDYNKRPNIDEVYDYIENEINNNNEIICTYNKNEKRINILHDYKSDYLEKEYKESYNEAKNNINEDNIEIYINNKKIKFNSEYESDEIGLITIKFKFKKLLTSTAFMFYYCKSLKSIDLSSFNTNNVTNMRYMFHNCSSLKSIDLSSFNTNNATDMSFMFYYCSSLKKENIKINKK